MMRALLSVLFLSLYASLAHAAGPAAQVVGPAPGAPLGYQQITSLSAATGLTIPTGANVACLTPETQAVRYRDDGTNPTASVGFPLNIGNVVCYKGDLAPLKFIEQTSGAILDVLYYRQ